MKTPPSSPTLDAIVARALAPYRDLLPPKTLAAMAEELEAAFSHPDSNRLLRTVEPAPEIHESGEVVIAAKAFLNRSNARSKNDRAHRWWWSQWSHARAACLA